MWNGSPGPRTSSALSSTAAKPSTSVKAPSEVACMCAKSITGRTHSRREAISRTWSIEPSSLTRPITSIPNGTARSFPSSFSRRVASEATTSSIDLLGRASEPEAGMDDDDLRAGRSGDPGGAVERAERHLRLLLVGVAREREQRRVHGQRDVLGARELAEPLGPRVVEPEAALEVELAGGVAALDEQLDREVGRLPRGTASRADADRSHEPTVPDRVQCRPTGVLPFSTWRRHRPASTCSSSTSTSGSPTSGARRGRCPSGTSRSWPRSCAPPTARGTATR